MDNSLLFYMFPFLNGGTVTIIASIFMFFSWVSERRNLKIFKTLENLYNLLYGYKTLVLSGRIVSTRHYNLCHMNDELKGLFLFLNNNLDRLENVGNVESIDITNAVDSNKKRCLNIPIQNQLIELPNKMKLGIKKIKEECKELKESHDVEKYDIKLVSKIHKFQEIKNFVNQCAESYKNYLISTTTQQMCFTFKGYFEEDDKNLFEVCPFHSTKTMDNLFFDGKEDIIERILFFDSREGKEQSLRLGMPHTLGILLHGLPGCGKTSFIKAIANLTGRHIVVIRMDIILSEYPDKCIDIIRQIMHSPHIGDEVVPTDKRIFVFEEADTWHEITMKRGKSITSGGHSKQKRNVSEENLSKNIVSMLENAINNGTVSTSSTAMQSNPTLKHILGGFLELMDGIVECPGRLCIMTTNHKELLDHALIRPGRFGDIIQKFDKLTNKNVCEMYKLWFGEELNVANVGDRVFSQAEIGQLFNTKNTLSIKDILFNYRNKKEITLSSESNSEFEHCFSPARNSGQLPS